MNRTLKNSVFTLVTLLTLVVATPALAQESTTTSTDTTFETTEPAPGTSCFDYYQFPSVDVNLSSKSPQAFPGDNLTFTGNVVNKNAYPLVAGSVYIKIFRKDANPSSDDVRLNGFYLVDQFFAKEDISIAGNGQIPLKVTWKVPGNAPAGEYQLATYYQVAKMYDMQGLSFTNDIVGNAYNFSVGGTNKPEVYFAKNNVLINKDTPFNFASFPPMVAQTGTTTVTTTLVNTTAVPQDVKVTWTTYKWSGIRNDFLLSTSHQMLTLKAGENKKLSIAVTDSKYPVYYVVAQVDYKDTKSILDTRFIREGNSEYNLQLPAVTSYPLTANVANTLFTCFHNVSNEVGQNGKVVVTLTDTATNKQITSLEYTGDVTPDMALAKKEFTPDRTYSNFTLTASIYNNGVLQDSAKLVYDCNAINPSFCSSTASTPSASGSSPLTTTTILLIILGIIIVIVIFFLIMKMKKRNTSTIIGLFLAIVIMSAMMTSVAQAVTDISWVPNKLPANRPLYANYRYGTNNPYITRTSITMSGHYHVGVYKITAPGAVTGDEIPDGGGGVAVNDYVRLKMIPHVFNDIYWNATGGYLASPYAYWVANAADPGGQLGVGLCAPSDSFPSLTLLNAYGSNGIAKRADAFVSFSVNPPTVDIHAADPAKLSCPSGAASGDEVAGWYKDCQILNTGQIAANFDFASTKGIFYFQQKNEAGACYDEHAFHYDRNHPATTATELMIPAKTGTVTFSAGGGTPPVGYDPKGYFDALSCDIIAGWSCDQDSYSTAVNVRIFQDGAEGAGGTEVTGSPVAATINRSDLASSCGNTTNHGYSIATPASLKDGAAHSVYVYGVDTQGRPDKLLNQAPRSITCSVVTVQTPTGFQSKSPTQCSDPSPTVGLLWNAVSGSTGYHVFRSNDNVTYTEVSGTGFVPNPNTGQISFNDASGLTSGTVYYYKVQAYNGSNQTSALTNAIQATASKPAGAPGCGGGPTGGNLPPNTPTIEGPTTGKVDTNYPFKITATDPESDKLHYGIDWNMSKDVNQVEWIPPTATDNSGISEQILRSWSDIGVKKFEVLAQDSHGNNSGWATWNINITDDTTTIGNCWPEAIDDKTGQSGTIKQAQKDRLVTWRTNDLGSGYTYNWLYSLTSNLDCNASPTATDCKTKSVTDPALPLRYSTVGLKFVYLSVTDPSNNTSSRVLCSLDGNPLPVSTSPIFIEK